MIVLERFSIYMTSSSWCIDIWCKLRRSRSGILIGIAKRLFMRLGNRHC